MKNLYLKQISLLILAVLVNISFTQAQKECGFDHIMEQAKENNPYFDQLREQVEAFTRNYAATAQGRTSSIVTIPTVVHLVHNGEAVGTYPNLSDAQVNSGISSLNQAFQNTGPFAGTAYYNNPINVQFVLAKVSPTGAASTGIERHDVSSKSYGTTYDNDGISSGGAGVPQNQLFGDFYWNPQDYMNVWLVKKIDGIDTGSGMSGTLGYATLPLTNPGVSDGLVCQARAFGYYLGYDHNNPPAGFDFGPSPSNLNGTANHEVGHYLNLHHTFVGDANGTQCPAGGTIGTNDDGCNDIPAHKRTDSVCPAYSATGNDCGGGSNEYIHNYMNYSNDQCFQGFSADQKTRCEAAINGPRSSFKTAIGHLTASGSFPAAIPATVTMPDATQGINTITLAGTTFTSQSGFADGGYLNRIASQPTVTLNSGTQYTMTVQVGVGSPSNNELVNVYIDYNGDNTFNETNERVFQAAGGTGKTNGDVFSFMFTVPTTGLIANQRVRMRVLSTFDTGTSYANFSSVPDGQIEDYSVQFSGVLPVELTNLTAQPKTKSILLEWETATEINNEGFEIQRSEDNSSFSTIEFVRGAGTSDVAQNYAYDDYEVTAGKQYYYRLKQIDLDGRSSYSYIVNARVKSDANEINVYPNPANSWLTVSKVEDSGTLEFEIYNALGVQVMRSTSTATTQRVNVAQLPLGNYYVRIQSDNGTSSVKKVVLGL